MSKIFQEGDPVLIIYDERRRWIKSVEDTQFHCNYGYINLLDIAGLQFGSRIETNKGKWLRVRPPRLVDWIDSFQHQSQIIYAKDAAHITYLLDAKIGDTIYEAGTGSGALTSRLARIVGPLGKIVTHDNRPEASKVATKNVKKIGLTNIEFHIKDVAVEGFAEGLADSVILDLVDPWRVITHVAKILALGGKLVIFQPTFNQLEKTTQSLLEHGFHEIKAVELLEREIQLKIGAIRPATRMIGHTGFLMSAIYFP